MLGNAGCTTLQGLKAAWYSKIQGLIRKSPEGYDLAWSVRAGPPRDHDLAEAIGTNEIDAPTRRICFGVRVFVGDRGSVVVEEGPVLQNASKQKGN